MSDNVPKKMLNNLIPICQYKEDCQQFYKVYVEGRATVIAVFHVSIPSKSFFIIMRIDTFYIFLVFNFHEYVHIYHSHLVVYGN